jgi:hypothetical protein
MRVVGNRSAAQDGLLRIVSPNFDPAQHVINAGCAMRVDGGGAVLSNFVQTEPDEVLDCHPVAVFHVAIGRYPTGTVVDLAGAMADPALCAGTQGHDTFDVVFEADGSWKVTAGHARIKRKAEGRVRAAIEATILNATIRNNAGTKLICQGRAVSTSIPVIIENLSAPRSLLVHSEYQVSLNNGPFRGFILTDLSDTGQAVFD